MTSRRDFLVIAPPVGKLLAGKVSPLLIEVRSPKRLRNQVEEFALHFKHEFNYDFVQYRSNEQPKNCKGYSPYEAWLFHEDAPDKYDIGEPEHRRSIGVCCFRSNNGYKGKPAWRLDWVWFHPFRRRRAIMSGQWSMFQERYGRFSVEKPLSLSMEQFLKKYNSET